MATAATGKKRMTQSEVINHFAEKTGMGYYLDVRFKREQLARYGLSIEDAEQVVTNPRHHRHFGSA